MNSQEAFNNYAQHLQFVSSQPKPFNLADNHTKVASLSLATDEYSETLKTAADGVYTIQDGLQALVNLARTAAHFDPATETNGLDNKSAFNNFINFLQQNPILTLRSSSTKEIKQASHNANELINSFVDAFNGIQDKDKSAVIKSVASLVSAALSWSEQTEKESLFFQNALTTETNGTKITAVTTNIYYSTFTVSVSKHKGTITYHSTYSLSQAVLALSMSDFNSNKTAIKNLQQQSLQEYLDSLKTKSKPGSDVKVPCLD